MALNFQTAPMAIQEMAPWKLESEKVSFKLSNNNPKYALVLVMAGDDPTLGGHVISDLREMQRGIESTEDISVLVLADYVCTGSLETIVYEFSNKTCNERARLPVSIDTGDPRPIADFLTMAFNSFEPDVKIALGFWGHGDGVAHDHLDPRENLVPEAIRKLPLGTKITKTMFLKHYLAEPQALKPKVFKSMLPDATSGGLLTNRELSSALTVAFSRSKRTEPVEMIFFDTCLNGTVEVYAELRRYAKTFVASSILVSETGWDYTHFLKVTQEKMPQTAVDWAGLAVSSWHRAYGQGYSKYPAQLTALNCETDSLERLKNVVDILQAKPCEAQELYAACKLLKGVIGQDESMDLPSLIYALYQATNDDALKLACHSFINSFRASLIAVSTGPANKGDKTSLSVWFPRMGDKFQVASYYQNYRFHKETGWFNVVHNFLHPKTKSSAPPVFLIIAFRGLGLISHEPIEELAYLRNPETDFLELRLDTPENPVWLEGFQEGRYSFKQAQSSTFASRSDFREFVDILLAIKRKSGEFALLEAATHSLVVASGTHLEQLRYHLIKYRAIIYDEFPDYVSIYDALLAYSKECASNGVVLFGDGRRSQMT